MANNGKRLYWHVGLRSWSCYCREIKIFKWFGGVDMQPTLNRKVAILVDDGFEQVELTEPRKALESAGAQTYVISPKVGRVKGWDHTDWGQLLPVDVQLDSADPSQYDALLLPGGVMNPDKLRMNPKAVKFVKAFVDAGKPIAAICHGPWTLIEAGAV